MSGVEFERLIAADAPASVVRRVLGDDFVRGHVEVARLYDSSEPATRTIVVPVFDQESFVGRCVDGLAAHVTAATDLVVVVDCCTDRSEAVVLAGLERARERFRRIVVLRTTYPVYETRADNLGFLISRGDHLIEVQCDIEVLTPGFDALLQAPMDEAPGIFATSGRGGHWFGQLLPREEVRRRFLLRSQAWRWLGRDQVGYTGNAVDRAASHAGAPGAWAEVETVMRGPWCLRRRELFALGLLDEQNFCLGRDDHDLHARGRVLGLGCAYVPMRFDSPLAIGASRRSRSGVNREAHDRLRARPEHGYLSRFLETYRPILPCRFRSPARPSGQARSFSSRNGTSS